MKPRLYYSNSLNERANSLYPHVIEITDEQTLQTAVSRDYVCCEYKNNHRKIENFIRSNVIGMDLDNDHSDNPNDHITVKDVKMAFPGVIFYVHYSRNHMKDKGEGNKFKSARPRFHILFILSEEIRSPEEYKAIKERILKIFPFFDNNALDAARFFFGTPNPKVEIVAGTRTLTEFLKEFPEPEETDKLPQVEKVARTDSSSQIIPQGSRNSTMYKLGTDLLRKYQDKNDAYKYFLEQAALCVPPLETAELAQIWNNAINTYDKSPKKTTLSFKPDDYSDIGQARIIAREYKYCLRYSTATDFLVYNGSYWESSGIKAHGLSHTMTDNQLAEAQDLLMSSIKNLEVTGVKSLISKMGEKEAVDMFSDIQAEAYRTYKDALCYQKHVMSRRNQKYIKSSLEAVRPMIEVDVKQLDANPFLLNTPSATYDLRTGTRQEHNPEDLITQQTEADPGEEGQGIWRSALNTFFCGDDDLIRYVQEIAGLASIGKVFTEALFIAYGKGRNGKSTFWNAISKVLGTYSWSMPAEMLTLGNGESKKYQKAELRGKRLVISAELEENTRLSTSTVKQLCSTDEITAERKYRDPFKFTPSHQLVLYTNHLPKVSSGSDDEGTWRRLKVIPFNAKIEGKQDIKNYADYLVEHAGGAILTWIIEGAKRIIQKGYHLDPPQVVKDATEQYKQSNDWLAEFMEDCCEIGETLTEKSGDLYSAYRDYCVQNDEPVRGTKVFYTSLEHAGFKRTKTRNCMIVPGIKIKH